jgi:hypothetical protein
MATCRIGIAIRVAIRSSQHHLPARLRAPEEKIMLDRAAVLPGLRRQQAEWPRNTHGQYATIAELLANPGQPFDQCDTTGNGPVLSAVQDNAFRHRRF